MESVAAGGAYPAGKALWVSTHCISSAAWFGVWVKELTVIGVRVGIVLLTRANCSYGTVWCNQTVQQRTEGTTDITYCKDLHLGQKLLLVLIAASPGCFFNCFSSHGLRF